MSHEIILKEADIKCDDIVKIISYNLDFTDFIINNYNVKIQDSFNFDASKAFTRDSFYNQVNSKFPIGLVAKIYRTEFYDELWDGIFPRNILGVVNSESRIGYIKYFNLALANNKEKLLYYLYGPGIYR